MHADCGKCLVSLMCHTGMLKSVLLCPKCGVFQVEHVQVRLVTRYEPDGSIAEDGVPVKSGDTITYRLECPVRYVTEDQYYDWCQEGEREACGDHDVDTCPPEEYDDLAELGTSILIPDQGPPQKQYTNNTGGAIPVKLCNECYGAKHVLRVS